MLLAQLEVLLNRTLADSTLARRQAAALAGTSLRLQLADAPLSVLVRVDDGHIALADGASGAADVTLSGGAWSLLALGGERRDQLMRSGAVHVSGDGELAERYAALFALIRPDVEHELGRLLGPGPAHLLALAGRGARDWLRRGVRRGLRNGIEYYAHEQRLLVPRAEAEHQHRQVELLRERLARLEARLAHLPAKADRDATP